MRIPAVLRNIQVVRKYHAWIKKGGLHCKEVFRKCCTYFAIEMLFAFLHLYPSSTAGSFTSTNYCEFNEKEILIMSQFLVKESCCVLLQTIPNHINIDVMCRELTRDFPDVLNVHDLHVWQFSKGKTICTAHIIFLNPQVWYHWFTIIEFQLTIECMQWAEINVMKCIICWWIIFRCILELKRKLWISFTNKALQLLQFNLNFSKYDFEFFVGKIPFAASVIFHLLQ